MDANYTRKYKFSIVLSLMAARIRSLMLRWKKSVTAWCSSSTVCRDSGQGRFDSCRSYIFLSFCWRSITLLWTQEYGSSHSGVIAFQYDSRSQENRYTGLHLCKTKQECIVYRVREPPKKRKFEGRAVSKLIEVNRSLLFLRHRLIY